MRKGFLLSVAEALLLACGTEDLPGPGGPGELHLAFTVQPSATVAGQVMTPAVQVSVQDAAGNPITSGTASVSLTLTNPLGETSTATLYGTPALSATNGVAVFNDLTIRRSGRGYVLRATATGLDAAISSGFAVLPGPAAAIAIHDGEAQEAAAGLPVPQPPSVLATDEFGNPVPDVNVVFEVASGGGSVEGAQATTGADGVAAVTSWTLGTSLGPNTLRATAGALTGSPVVFNATATPFLGAATVTIGRGRFNPNPPYVSIGGAASVSIMWIDRDGRGLNLPPTIHHIVSDNGAFAPSSNLTQFFASYRISLTAAGDYPYHCSIHPNERGTIHVIP